MASQFTGAWQARDHVAASIGPLMPDDWATIGRQTANRVNGVVASKKVTAVWPPPCAWAC